MKRTILFALAGLALAACGTDGGSGPAPSGPSGGPAYTPNSGGGPEAFRDSDFGWSPGHGGGEIDGVLTYKGGSCTGSSVVLAPETAWSRARMRVLYLSNNAAAMPVDEVQQRTPPEHNQEYAKYARRATCDANNKFTFTGLPSGAWYVITVSTPPGGGQKMAVMRRVETHGDTVKVNLH